MNENDEGRLRVTHFFDDSERAVERPLYERMVEADHGPITGALSVSGVSVDEMIANAQKQVERVAGEREAKITSVQLSPMFLSGSSEIRLWNASVEFEILSATSA